ncbi:TonB-dependent receptor [Maribacter sp. MJ134]|uniref:carboxypeptidase-like regulatory domain-containing protein n=1 Tax=Maribacter sp. MJ134 TaxID=2496865 RepID=UPI000F82FAC7|nr:carboxypeptidase-like regulatory domain-containing protein [Maribacter sp. MJ134]AZQ60027.1 TonB-dependent receptor [Maribacter sp. MJ134]
MHRFYLFILLFLYHTLVMAQKDFSIVGIVLDVIEKSPMPNALVSIEGDNTTVRSNQTGAFSLTITEKGEFILNIALAGYTTKRIPIFLEGKNLDLGSIYLDKDITFEKKDNLITITDSELLDNESSGNALGLLQATRDVFLTRAAFDFGQAFFRVRGYDAEHGEVLLNGIRMNKLFNGRPQWNNWGGLNDVVRNQQFSNGLNPSDFTFGGILGNTNIDLRPSGLRPGFRISSSASNRTYTGRLMATYNSGMQSNGLAYMFSASRRWAKEGYIDGTLYDAYSFYGALEYQINKKNSLSLTAFSAVNRRGRSSAITEEVFNLVGNRYNPYWGNQKGNIRNSRERKVSEPMVLVNYLHKSNNLNLNVGFAYQTGINARSRLGYFNAPNPDPTYYRYLPSLYINSAIGANFIGAEIARNSFLRNPQLNWERLYDANENTSLDGKAAYVFYDDTVADTQFTSSLNANLKLTDKIKLDFGITNTDLRSKNYAKIIDLLGASFHEDIDTFSDTRNNILQDVKKEEGDKFGYNYEFAVNRLNMYAQVKGDFGKLKTFIAGNYANHSYERNGLYENERFLENSFGKSSTISFSNFGVKGGATYKITGRHWLAVNGALLNNAPLLQNVFVNPRESNEIVPNLQDERISSIDMNYFIRMPKLTGRFGGFYTRFQNTTDINFFFVDSGVGSDFVQEVLTDLDKLHLGTELGLEYQLSASVKLSAVASIGKYVYASDPLVTINFDTASAQEELIDVSGSKNLGFAAIKDYKLAQGPQQAFALGMEYRDPKYWWIALTTNYLAKNYANISTITRTASFYVDPETGENFPDATVENVNNLLAQKPLDNFYLLNLVGGKSWLKKGKYIGVFASVNNLFDEVYRTGGYEQSRNGNFGQLRQDNLSGSPSFAPKYWYGYGRTYFLNVAISF